MQVLEKYFDTAFDAPDGIKKLRELILTLAMQGKLVSQDPNEQPARELLTEIEQEKQHLIKESKIKQIKPISKIKENEIPYDLPESWKWVRLSEIAEYNGRKNIYPEFIDDVWLLDLEDIEKTTSNLIYRAKYSERKSKSTKSTFVKGDVLYGKLRPYLDKVIVADQDGVCTTEIVPIVPYKKIDPYFLRYLLKRPAFLKFVDGLMYGVKMPRLGTQDAINSIHPIPPFEEQKRIVKKINHLMVLCDKLEKLKQQKEDKKLTAHKSAINQLLEAKSYKNWNFISNHFNELYTVKENVSELRSAILQLAMQGKLVEQDPNDQPATELLKEIEKEKNQLIKEKKAKKSNLVKPMNKDNIPFNIPNNWTWSNMYDISIYIQRGKGPKYIDNSPFKVVSQKCVRWKGLDLKPARSIDPDSLNKYEDIRFLKEDDLLWNSTGTGTIGRACLVSSEDGDQGLVADSHVTVVRPYNINPKFLFFWVQSPYVYNEIENIASGTTNQIELNTSTVVNHLIPIPPLNEQKRIVEKINQFMSLCDELESHIESSSLKKTELLNTIMSKLEK